MYNPLRHHVRSSRLLTITVWFWCSRWTQDTAQTVIRTDTNSSNAIHDNTTYTHHELDDLTNTTDFQPPSQTFKLETAATPAHATPLELEPVSSDNTERTDVSAPENAIESRGRVRAASHSSNSASSSSSSSPAPSRPPHTAQEYVYEYYMSEPKKQEKDYTKEVDEALPEAKSLAEVCGMDETC